MECNWNPAKHGGKPCPVHGGGGQPGAGGHQIRINQGKYEARVSPDADWEETSPEEYAELREGGYQDFDETNDDDFGFDEGGNDLHMEALSDVVDEMEQKGIDIHNAQAVLNYLENEGYEDDSIEEITQYISDTFEPESDEDEEDGAEEEGRRYFEERYGSSPDDHDEEEEPEEPEQKNYATIAAEMSKDGIDTNDKDAVLEQLFKKYNFSDEEIRDYMKNVYGDSMEGPKPQANKADLEKRKRELSNEYWGLAEDYQMQQRMNDDEWNARGFPDFEEKYGTEEEFIEKGLKGEEKPKQEQPVEQEKPEQEEYVRYPDGSIRWKDEWYEDANQLSDIASDGSKRRIRNATDEEVKQATDSDNKLIQEFLNKNEIALDSPIAQGLTPANKKFILSLMRRK